MEYIALPNREDAIIAKSGISPLIDVSGSMGLEYNGKCNPTFPNQTIIGDRKYDWCSNIAEKDEVPWISYTFPQKAMKLKGYAVRNGCCYYPCCCDPTTGRLYDDMCCCELYSYSLQGSNDNHTWKVLHSIEKDADLIHYCEYKTYEFPMTEPYRFVRFVLDEERPGCYKCLQLNQLELYGELVQSFSGYESLDEDNEESISIIGKIKKY